MVLNVLRLTNPRRQQYRRLRRAGRAGVSAIAIGVAGALAFAARAPAFGIALLVVAALLGLDARRWIALAARSGVGARSEDDVWRVLLPLRRDGWRLRRSVGWRGCGDIDVIAVSPEGVVVVIEVKTRHFDRLNLALVCEQAEWFARRRRWRRGRSIAVLCLTGARRVERYEDGVLVVSLDRLVGAVRWAVLRSALEGSGDVGEREYRKHSGEQV